LPNVAHPITFAREPLTDALWDEALPLLVRHYHEIAAYQDIPLAPDRNAYRASEQAGIIRVYTARTDTELVGYALWFVRPSPHYSTSVQAMSDVIFLDQPLRGINGWKFLKFMDSELQAEGVQVAYHHVKLAHDWTPILARMGYAPHDIIYARRMDQPVVKRTNREDAVMAATITESR